MEPQRVCQAGVTIKSANTCDRTPKFNRRAAFLLSIAETSKRIGPIREGAYARAGDSKVDARRESLSPCSRGQAPWTLEGTKKIRADSCSVVVRST